MRDSNYQHTIKKAVDHLVDNLDTVARVGEWATLMGYSNAKKFSRHYLKCFQHRPSEKLEEVRLNSVVQQLRDSKRKSNLQIAWEHSFPDEKSLYNFVKYHLGCSPTQIKCMSDIQIADRLERHGSTDR